MKTSRSACPQQGSDPNAFSELWAFPRAQDQDQHEKRRAAVV